MTTMGRNLVALASLFVAAGGRAQDTQTPPPTDPDLVPHAWDLQIEPTFWYAALGGDVAVGGGGDVSMETLDTDDSNPGGAAEVHFRRGRLTLTLFGAGVGVDDSASAREAFNTGGLNVAQGDPVDTRIDYVQAHAALGWRVWNWPPAELSDRWDGPIYGESKVTIGLDLYAGLRLQWMDVEIRSPGGAVDGDGVFVQPIIGARIEFELTRHFSIDLAVDGGYIPGDDFGSSSIGVMVGFQWRPWDNVGFQIGFRQTFFQLHDEEELEYEGSIGGLMASVVLRF